MAETRIVIPCHNEARRLDATAFLAGLRDDPGLRYVFVDDGSDDETLERLRAIEREADGRAAVLALAPNRGKAVAVQCGIRAALGSGAAFVGFLDADLATPVGEIRRLREALELRPELEGAIASRVGDGVSRAPARRAAGRLSAWAVSRVLRLATRDASCGAKLFRADETTRTVFQAPFLSRWIFDAEILVRYRILAGGSACEGPPPPVLEVPVLRWDERGGSSIRATDYGQALGDLFRIRRHYASGRWPGRMAPPGS